jgi:hypothetical protein
MIGKNGYVEPGAEPPQGGFPRQPTGSAVGPRQLSINETKLPLSRIYIDDFL